MTGTRDPLNAFLDYPAMPVASETEGPLAGLTLAVKDIFDVAGYPTGGGNPAKLARSPIAVESASCVQVLLDSGARFLGKTQTEELTFSMIGMNAHFPSPVNVRAPQRVTGGSSSGSVAAVAGGLADIALGSDTNSSIRAPASFCGLLGLRTSWGRIPIDHTMPLAPSFDAVGWFAKDAVAYAKVGEILLGEDSHDAQLVRPVRSAEFEALLFGEAERDAYRAMASGVLGHFDRAEGQIALPATPAEIFDCFKVIQAYEAWQVHGPFITSGDPELGPGVRERFDYARGIGDEEVRAARKARAGMVDAFASLFDDDMVMVLPTQPSAAPLKSSTQEELERYRNKALVLSSFAGLLGWPQISIPLGAVHDAPFGISLLGPAGSDRQLIRLAATIMARN